MALILGIYERLVNALSRVDLSLLRHIRHGRILQGAAHMDARFLTAIGCGVLAGIVTIGSAMKNLLESEASRSVTMAVFFGMILGSTAVVAKMVCWSHGAARLLAIAAIAGILAFWVTGLNEFSGTTHPAYVFASGMIAICAMILPGVSGAYLLVILGLYGHVTDILDRLRSGDVQFEDIQMVAFLGAGCVVGIILFSKVLRWLLAQWHNATLAVLCGLMIGALRKIWPFQHDLTPDTHEFKHKIFEPVWPETLTSQVTSCLVAAVLAMSAVLLIERVSRRPDSAQPPSSTE